MRQVKFIMILHSNEPVIVRQLEAEPSKIGHSFNKGAFNNHVDRRRGEGVSKMSMIIHAREGGGFVNVHFFCS